MKKNSSAGSASNNYLRGSRLGALAALMTACVGTAVAQVTEPMPNKAGVNYTLQESIDCGFASPGGVLSLVLDMIEGKGVRMPDGSSAASDTLPSIDDPQDSRTDRVLGE